MLGKKNKGITLVALVITVVILLILSGVTINSLSGDNRYFKNNISNQKRNRRCSNYRKNESNIFRSTYRNTNKKYIIKRIYGTKASR